ncbi:cytochrome b [Pseudovibrio exalbescens]|uniref:Cytochrome B n=1 Tax=Pseudovibrio exalbescens TaxID=197461 RepID=A0A1U7JEF2_9HYPH|nr:cytochrome b [Pseudovibrio exalbescens]OKL43119.1 cytochrome B [Pseudovibrio exalbescens]
MIKNTHRTYGLIAITFHWLMALMIIGLLGLGLYMVDLPLTDQRTFELYQLHKSFGFVILVLAVLRLVWRTVNPSPKLPETMPFLERMAAHLGHAGLYGLMLFLPLSGWLMVSASPWGVPTVIFDSFTLPHLPVPDFLGTKETAEATLKTVHEWGAYLLIALIVLHIAAALKHHFISRDDVLRRMTRPS